MYHQLLLELPSLSSSIFMFDLHSSAESAFINEITCGSTVLICASKLGNTSDMCDIRGRRWWEYSVKYHGESSSGASFNVHSTLFILFIFPKYSLQRNNMKTKLRCHAFSRKFFRCIVLCLVHCWIPVAYQVAKTFFHTNHGTCRSWINRIHRFAVPIALHSGNTSTAVNMGMRWLHHLAFTAEPPERVSTLMSRVLA